MGRIKITRLSGIIFMHAFVEYFWYNNIFKLMTEHAENAGFIQVLAIW
jgi:hypothetical protein